MPTGDVGRLADVRFQVVQSDRTIEAGAEHLPVSCADRLREFLVATKFPVQDPVIKLRLSISNQR